ncbi:unnamed protein product [Bursaphelenchus xylophilus]|uniref:(pine wood nematode) hypothetical protein n=1 Tax=Bursaphelenchus xylophilus TaxID=6326 RepID=A0A7I8X3S4_BURXY|nr:unnamed protein product [Bursaphelenchus xylophilus]CAG9128615.1 unnamed protein product [Bursaphelenchus xylophilus]
MSRIVYEDPDYKIKEELASYKMRSGESKEVKKSRKSKSSMETREVFTITPSGSKSAEMLTTIEVYNEDKPDCKEASQRLMEMLRIGKNDITDEEEETSASEWEDEELNGRRRVVDGEEEEDEGECMAYGEHDDFKVPLEQMLEEKLGFTQDKNTKPYTHKAEKTERCEDSVDQRKNGQNYRLKPRDDILTKSDRELPNKGYDEQYSRDNAIPRTNHSNASQSQSFSSSRISEPNHPSLPVVIRTQPEPDGLKWYHDRPSPGHGAALREFKDAIFPLSWPMNLVQGTSTLHHYFDRPIDYLISWSDECAAYGFVKEFEDATDTVPLCVRFGGFWSLQAVKSMYIGCTVRVKGYLELKADVYHDEVLPVVPRGTDKSGFIFGGIPKASAFALEWAVISRPAIIRSIGLLKEDISYEEREKLHLVGIVKDVEYNEEFTVCQSKWPTPSIKCLPCPPYPVVINWLEIREKVIMHPTRHKSILLPEYIHHYMRTSEPTNGYVLGWVDLEMKPSRTFDD